MNRKQSAAAKLAIEMALAVLRAELEAGRASGFPLAALGRRPGLCLLLAFTAFVIGVPGQHGDIFLPWYGVETHLAIGIGSGLLVLAAVIPAPQRARASVASLGLVWLAVVAAAVVLGAASYYLVEQPVRGLERRVRMPGRPGENDETVQPRLDSLNSAGVAVDHLA